MMYFTVKIEKEKSEYVKVCAPNVLVAVKWAVEHCTTEGATVEDVVYVNGEPVAVVEG